VGRLYGLPRIDAWAPTVKLCDLPLQFDWVGATTVFFVWFASTWVPSIGHRYGWSWPKLGGKTRLRYIYY